MSEAFTPFSRTHVEERATQDGRKGNPFNPDGLASRQDVIMCAVGSSTQERDMPRGHKQRDGIIMAIIRVPRRGERSLRTNRPVLLLRLNPEAAAVTTFTTKTLTGS